ncbi:hypothetical protein FBU30_005014 [Linnemannia zychae]|nr:hypothetical protein FBU30_005014 [Linnemannia zychae]
MSLSISHTVESESQLTSVSLKSTSVNEEILVDTPLEVAQDAASADPLATITSVPSSDDDMDENCSIDGTADNSSSANVDVVNTPRVNAVVTTAATEISAIEAADDEVAAIVATSFAEGFSLDDRPETVVATNPPSPTQTLNESTSSRSTPQPKEVAALVAAATAVVSEGEVRKPSSRPLSRQELRRKSSFFNSKEIVVSDQRFSSSTSASMRPIADPRFKSRFQSILSQWKARE